MGGVQQPDVTPVFKNRAYVLRRERMRTQYESARSGVSICTFVLVQHVNFVVKTSDACARAVMKEQARVKQEVETQQAADLAKRNAAASLIQVLLLSLLDLLAQTYKCTNTDT